MGVDRRRRLWSVPPPIGATTTGHNAVGLLWLIAALHYASLTGTTGRGGRRTPRILAERAPLGTAKLRIPRRNIIIGPAGWLIIALRPYLLRPLSPRAKPSRPRWKPTESSPLPSLILTNVSVRNSVPPAAKPRFDSFFGRPERAGTDGNALFPVARHAECFLHFIVTYPRRRM